MLLLMSALLVAGTMLAVKVHLKNELSTPLMVDYEKKAFVRATSKWRTDSEKSVLKPGEEKSISVGTQEPTVTIGKDGVTILTEEYANY